MPPPLQLHERSFKEMKLRQNCKKEPWSPALIPLGFSIAIWWREGTGGRGGVGIYTISQFSLINNVFACFSLFLAHFFSHDFGSSWISGTSPLGQWEFRHSPPLPKTTTTAILHSHNLNSTILNDKSFCFEGLLGQYVSYKMTPSILQYFLFLQR